MYITVDAPFEFTFTADAFTADAFTADAFLCTLFVVLEKLIGCTGKITAF